MESKKSIVTIEVLAVMLMMTACHPNSPTPRPVVTKEYREAYLTRHGHCYDSIEASVLSLDLYSEGLTLDSVHRMQGTGYNLYVSDIFVEDSLLTAGTYTADSVAQRFTFLPGRDFEGMPTGAYLLYVNDGKLESIQLIDSGYFVVRDTLDGIVDISLHLYYGSTTYDAHYQGPLMLN